MPTLYHRCGQALDVAEQFGADGRLQRFVFLDVLTADAYDRCPRCDRTIAPAALTIQPPKVSRAKPRAAREARRLIRRAQAQRAARSAA